MQVVVESLLTEYQESGKGKRAVLLLHGWGDTHKTFAQLQAELAKKFTVISLDLPGFGNTQPPNEVWDLSNYAGFVKSFLSKIDREKIHAVVGHSNGSALAIHAVAEKMLQPSKLVLLSAAGIRDRQKIRRFVLKIIAKLGKLATFWLPRSTKQKLRKKLYGTVGSDLLVAPHIQETFKKTVRQDVQKDAAKIDIPTLLVYGDKDTATPKQYGEIYASAIPDASLEVLPGEHFIHHDQQEQTTKLIQEFLV